MLERRPLNDNIIIFPDNEKTKVEIENLRSQLTLAVLERDELLYTICPNLEMAYVLAFGSLEYKVYKAQCDALRLKRKIDLIQASLNRQEIVSLSEIDAQLEHEFQNYQKRLNEWISKINAAVERSNGPFLSKAEENELKKRYHRIVKALHPDLNPGAAPEQLQLFQTAVTAYENGDLATIRLIEEMLEGEALLEEQDNRPAQLKREKERLLSALEKVRRDIRRIKCEFPYTMKDFLQNSEQVEEYRLELQTLFKHYNDTIRLYTERISSLMEE
ncbi:MULTISPECIES: J domain-containing protein [unclassified Clostridium]|uniref:J domain-containing protein n=1 Tax=unclassified Clostridium TaxID=2614128 RepID=UPI001107412A|nr:MULTISPECIES: J domain-containing protein [unclassified Clostridium]